MQSCQRSHVPFRPHAAYFLEALLEKAPLRPLKYFEAPSKTTGRHLSIINGVTKPPCSDILPICHHREVTHSVLGTSAPKEGKSGKV